MLDVVDVGFDAFSHCGFVGVAVQSAGLGESGDSGAHPMADSVAPNRVGVALRVAFHVGARSDEAHVAAKHVPELGQLVEVARTQPRVQHPRIAGNRLKVRVGMGVHTAELPNRELIAPVAVSGLCK